MIIIHQAIYGEVPGETSGHDLLAASDETNNMFRRVSGYTDLADRPEGGILSYPVVRGFFTDDHYLLIKSFPDESPGLRSARVFSHALFISKADLHLVRNLLNLLQHHLSSIQKEAQMHPIEYQSPKSMSPRAEVNGREAIATNALLKGQPFVWLGMESYWEWVARIWVQLPIRIKHVLKIGAAFNPSYVKNESVNLLYIPEDSQALWKRHSFSVISIGQSEILESSAANWIVGDTKRAAPFQTLLEDFAPKITSIQMLNQLEDYGHAYHQIQKRPSLNQLLVLAHFISQISPNESVGIVGKRRLLNAILQAIPYASVNMFIALIYQSWKGFPNAINSASNNARDWLSDNLFLVKNTKESGDVLIRALEAGNKNWWVNIVLEYISGRVKRRKPSDALIIWQWIKNKPKLIVQHDSWLPSDAENELIAKIPKLETATAKAVVQMSKEKGWLVLHAIVALQCYSAEISIQAQLRIDTDENYTLALEALSKRIKESLFVRIAADLMDARLYYIAGKLIAGNNTLLKGIEIASEGWQRCWEVAIEQGKEVWSGILLPKKTLFEILDHLLAGNKFSGSLLYEISIGKYSSLKDYPQRALIWSKLQEKALYGFITTTFVELVDDLANGKLSFQDLEAEFKSGVQSMTVQQNIIASKTIPLSKKLEIFNLLPSLGESQAQQLLLNNHFSLIEAKEFGRLVSKNNWKTVVGELYNIRFHRKDLVPALLGCSHLLGFWERLKLSASGLKRDAISSEEWWNQFMEITSQLFPAGPEQNGLWESAGGDLSQLYTSGSGREKWSHAVRLLRNNGSPTTKILVKKMRETYYGNEILKNLQDTLL